MEEYLRIVLEQIRCKKAKPMIEQELKAHMEDQIDENKAQGMSEHEAICAAVKDMGDPVETGVSLDGIHRPQMAWGMIGLVAALCICSLLVNSLLSNQQLGIHSTASLIWKNIIGFAVMIGIYRLDYSVLAKYGKLMAAAFLAWCIAMLPFAASIGGVAASIWIIGIGRVNLLYLLLLFIPLYGAVLYQYHGTGKSGVVRAIIWLLIPCAIALRLPNWPLAAGLFVMMGVMLSFAIIKKWFLVNGKRCLLLFWGCFVGVPFAVLALATQFPIMHAYQKARVSALFSDEVGSAVVRTIRNALETNDWIGSGQRTLVSWIPDLQNSYLLTFLSSYYGIAFAAAVCALLAILILRVFQMVLGQKNQLGSMVGLGCCLVLFLNTAVTILANTGLLKSEVTTFLPFFTGSGSGLLVSFISMGLILSVYRYKSILPARIVHETVKKRKSTPGARRELRKAAGILR